MHHKSSIAGHRQVSGIKDMTVSSTLERGGGLPSGSVIKNLPAMKRLGFDPWVGRIPWRRAWQPSSVFLPGESHGLGAGQATVHRVTKSDTTEET